MTKFMDVLATLIRTMHYEDKEKPTSGWCHAFLLFMGCGTYFFVQILTPVPPQRQLEHNSNFK
jgi:hypothetical protein